MRQGHERYDAMTRRVGKGAAELRQLVEKTFRAVLAARLIALRAIRSLALCIMK